MRVAVVGSGVSGLAATWLLNEYSDHTVELYEADPRPGGHANTVEFSPPGEGRESVDVDTGFIVFNPTTYPNFLRFLRLHKNTRDLVLPTEMTFSVSRDSGAFEWAGKNLLTVFCQPKNLLDPAMWRLLWDVTRFNAMAGRILLQKDQENLSIGDYLKREAYSASFRDNYLIPMTAAIWSTPPSRCIMDFPAMTLIQFLHNHHLLQITGKPSWLTLKGGRYLFNMFNTKLIFLNESNPLSPNSKAYVNQILSKLDQSRLHISSPVESLTRLKNSNLLLKTTTGISETYDHVILACHSDDAMRILRNGEGIEGGQGITLEEEKILGAFQWNKNEVILHSDLRLMPRCRMAWSCWNYIAQSWTDSPGRAKANSKEVILTYGMNDLQHIPESKYGPVLVTLNAPFEPHKHLIAGRWKYDHPVIDHNAVTAQQQISSIQGTAGVSFAGAYLRYGFHEDGFTSGIVAAASLSSNAASVHPPFEIEYAAKNLDRSLGMEFIAGIFEWTEKTGIRSLVGFMGSMFLSVLRLLLVRTWA